MTAEKTPTVTVPLDVFIALEQDAKRWRYLRDNHIKKTEPHRDGPGYPLLSFGTDYWDQFPNIDPKILITQAIDSLRRAKELE